MTHNALPKKNKFGQCALYQMGQDRITTRVGQTGMKKLDFKRKDKFS